MLSNRVAGPGVLASTLELVAPVCSCLFFRTTVVVAQQCTGEVSRLCSLSSGRAELLSAQALAQWHMSAWWLVMFLAPKGAGLLPSQPVWLPAA
jgi:hypothetical protein